MERVVLITGTRKGLGRGLAEHFLEQGDLVCGCSRKPTTLEHERYRHFEVDVADERAVVGMLRQISRDYKRLDVCLNNAGIASMNALLLTPTSAGRSIFETNTLGTFTVLRESAKLMLRAKQGRIINFSTVAVALDLEGEALYAASKAAVESITRIAARELGSYGITVNAIGPTPIKTDLIKLVPEEKLKNLVERQGIRRFGELRDVTNVVDFLVSPASDFISGQVIYLGGVTP